MFGHEFRCTWLAEGPRPRMTPGLPVNADRSRAREDEGHGGFVAPPYRENRAFTPSSHTSPRNAPRCLPRNNGSRSHHGGAGEVRHRELLRDAIVYDGPVQRVRRQGDAGTYICTAFIGSTARLSCTDTIAHISPKRALSYVPTALFSQCAGVRSACASVRKDARAVRESLDLISARDAPRGDEEANLVASFVRVEAHSSARAQAEFDARASRCMTAVRFATTPDERDLLMRNEALIAADRIELHLGDSEIALVHHCKGNTVATIMRHERERAPAI